MSRNPLINPPLFFTNPIKLPTLRGIKKAQPYVPFLRKLGSGVKPVFLPGLNGLQNPFLPATGCKALKLPSQQPPQFTECPWNNPVLLPPFKVLVKAESVQLVIQHLKVREIEPLHRSLTGIHFPDTQLLPLGCTRPLPFGAAVDPHTFPQVLLTLKLRNFPT